LGGRDHTSGLDGTLLVIGFVIALVGAILMLVAVIPSAGRHSHRERATRMYFPIVTCLVLSVILSLVM
jgi:hypothetical protein